MEKVKSREKLIKETCWDYAKFSFEKDGTYGFSWQQRNYRCSFCKKEFKSAQALGGHMNVHRRDRAKMRLVSSPNSSSNIGLNNSNPKTKTNPPDFVSSSCCTSSAAKFLPYMTESSSSFTDFSSEEKVALVSRSQCDHPAVVGKNLNKRALLEDRELAVLKKMNDSSRVWKKKEMARLDLNMGLFRNAKDDLDLELRLGLS
ncbi:hypothetical protein ACH5RR_020260 [Cinchona calisaya]|uniref:C2H2-type domain-containing protein n=1 Tax=Cinchona calisaya TaxID=153742 RepID=A0ABD2ZDX9_9GENT